MKSIDWAIAPLPEGPKGRATYLAGEQLVIFRQSKYPQEAWNFVRWVLKPEVQAFFSMKSGYLPVRKSVLTMKECQDYLVQDKALAAFVEQMREGRARRSIDYHRVEINRALAEALERATIGKGDPSSELKRASALANALLKTAEEKRTRVQK
jgi:ABC-type glycerol-3-phosphate transport system substrate-binding protein